MPRRTRRNAESGIFEDPLKNYSPPQFDDEFEQALIEDEVAEMDTTPVETVSADATVEFALQDMAQKDIGSLLVLEGDRLIGIVSERDVLTKVSMNYDQVKDQPVTTVMTPNPVVCYETDPPAKALNLMSVGSFRHIPVLDVDDKVVGVLGPRRVTRYLERYLPFK